MEINENWQARFLLGSVEPVKVSRLQSLVANLANRVICGLSARRMQRPLASLRLADARPRQSGG